jgi:hypothetical protein
VTGLRHCQEKTYSSWEISSGGNENIPIGDGKSVNGDYSQGQSRYLAWRSTPLKGINTRKKRHLDQSRMSTD